MIVVVVQARLGSTRLPGKVMRDLLGMPVLGHVLTRARAIPLIDTVCCAMPEGRENDPVAEVAAHYGARVTRGPENDVLARYRIAARECGATAVVRVTSDCPLLDPRVSGQVVADFTRGGADYVSNVDPRSWPRGLDTEVFSRAALEWAADAAEEAFDREHVTPWLRRAPDIMRRNVSQPDDRTASWRWTLDYPEDLEFMRRLLGLVPPYPHIAGFQELESIIDKIPAIAEINAHRSAPSVRSDPEAVTSHA